MKVEANHPKLIQKQKAKETTVSDSTIERFRKAARMDSLYNENKTKERTPKDLLYPHPIKTAGRKRTVASRMVGSLTFRIGLFTAEI